jgi:choline dehydrogenase
VKHYDYVIVGAGSAGCVLANRLSNNPKTSVAVIEAGPSSNSWKVDMPGALLYTMHDPKLNWKYYSEPEPYLNNRRIYCPRGKMIGGCSSHNGMVFIRGHAQDYNRWAQKGLTKWSYSHVLPYFKKIESWSEGENEYRGGNGPMHISKSNITDTNFLFKAVIKAAQQAGYPFTNDANGYKQEGFCTFDFTVKDGKRYGTSKAYMQEIYKRKNVDIFLKSQVQKIIIENKTAKGVEVLIKGKKNVIHADLEVILSCGSINSPKLLMHSGIGDAKELQKLGIKVNNNLPGVGKNLQDHLEIYTQYKNIQSVSLYSLFNSPFVQVYEGIKWFLFKKGMLSHSHLEVGGFVRSSQEFDHPNLQFHFFPSLVINHGLGKPDCHAFQFHVSPNRPTSRGWVKLNSLNPSDDPIIKFNYLETEEDRKQMRDSVKISRKIFAQDAFKSYLGSEISPGIKKQSDDELDEVIRNKADTAYHPSCTNKMGLDKMSVVNAETKVYGIENLRIVDSSIMPDIVSGNINAATLMIAEKASDLILGKKEEEPQDVKFYQAA